MAVELRITDSADSNPRTVPIAVQRIFVERWLPLASALGLDWVTLIETGFDVTDANRPELVDQLERLSSRVTEEDTMIDNDRLATLLTEIRALRFELGAKAFLG